jgi:hypothetical protein
VEATALEAVTRRQHVKTQQNEKTSYVLYWTAECVIQGYRSSYL